MRPHVILMGPVGCGKTTIAFAVADRLERPVLDNDAVLEATVGISARQMFETVGLERLHATEILVLRRMIAEPEPSVITAAASTLANAPTEELRPHFVVLLECAPHLAAARAAERSALHARRAPNVAVDHDAWHRRLRRIGDLADVVIDTAATTVDDAAHAITALVES